MGAFDSFALLPEQGAVPEKEQLSGDMQRQIEKVASGLNVHDASAVMGFGARAQKEMDAFSSLAMQQMLREDIKPLEGTLQTLAEQIRSCQPAAEAKSFFRKLTGAAAPLQEVRSAYEKAVPKINACADDMTDRRVALMRDSAMLQRLYEKNEALYRELCSLIVVGQEALEQSRARGDSSFETDRLDRRLQDIRITRAASTQLAAQIVMVRESDRLACERLQAALDVTIPLWKAQMAAALGMARAADSLSAEKSYSRTASAGIRSSASELASQTGAFKKNLGTADRDQAQQTSEKLLGELSDIVSALDGRKNVGAEK